MPKYDIYFEKIVTHTKSVSVTALNEKKAWEIAEKLPDEDFEFSDNSHNVEWGTEPHIHETDS